LTLGRVEDLTRNRTLQLAAEVIRAAVRAITERAWRQRRQARSIHQPVF
jgi:hypothetical protein